MKKFIPGLILCGIITFVVVATNIINPTFAMALVGTLATNPGWVSGLVAFVTIGLPILGAKLSVR